MSNRDSGTSWFLAQYKPNSHLIAERNLTRQGFRTFLPLQEETKRVRGQFVTRVRPLCFRAICSSPWTHVRAAGARSIPLMVSRGW